MSRKTIEDILIRRDGITRREAEQRIILCSSEVEDAIACGDFDLVDDIVAGDLCLEMDYIIDLLI